VEEKKGKAAKKLDKDIGSSLLTASDDASDDEDFPLKVSIKDVEVPVKAKTQLDRALYNRGRIRHNGASKTHMPDFAKMTRHDSKSLTDPYDREWMSSYTRNPLGEGENRHKTFVGSDVLSALKGMSNSQKFSHRSSGTSSRRVMTESTDDPIYGDEADAREHREVLIIDDDGGDER
jgi:hypothetical protein